MTISKDAKPQNHEQTKVCPISCDKANEVKEYMDQFKKTGDIQYIDRAHYCLFKIRDKEKGLI